VLDLGKAYRAAYKKKEVVTMFRTPRKDKAKSEASSGTKQQAELSREVEPEPTVKPLEGDKGPAAPGAGSLKVRRECIGRMVGFRSGGVVCDCVCAVGRPRTPQTMASS
jgi:hypothetical protein